MEFGKPKRHINQKGKTGIAAMANHKPIKTSLFFLKLTMEFLFFLMTVKLSLSAGELTFHDKTLI